MKDYKIYSVYTLGYKVNRHHLTKQEAEELKQKFIDEGYNYAYITPCTIKEFLYIVYSYDNPSIPKYIRNLLNTETIWLDDVSEEDYYITYTGNSYSFYDFQENKTLAKQYKAMAKRLQKEIKSIYDLDFTIYIKGYILEADGQENIL